MLQTEVEALPPRWLSSAEQVEQAKSLYRLKREILATEDERIIEDWRKLTAVDYMEGTDFANIQAVLADLKARAEKVKKAQAVEISRAYTKRHDRGNIDVRPAVDNTVVQVNFGVRPVAKPITVETGKSSVQEAEVAEAEVEEDTVVPVQTKSAPAEKPRGIRKVIRRLVIE